MFTFFLMLYPENHTLHYSPTSSIIYQQGPVLLITCLLTRYWDIRALVWGGTAEQDSTSILLIIGTTGTLRLRGLCDRNDVVF